jgi:hypothetical protein
MEKEQVPQFETMCKIVKRGHLLEIHEDHVLFGFKDLATCVDDAVECKEGGFSVEIDTERPTELRVLFK